MLLTIGDVIDPNTLANLTDILPKLRYEDGRATAGSAATTVKRNEQARGSVTLDLIRDQIGTALLNHRVFAAASLPKTLTKLLISKTGAGGHYGTHIDNPIIGGIRTDIAFTVFLSDPNTYEGGELILETTAGEEGYKLPAGHAVIYPATSLHRVAPVLSGERYVAVGWAQSYIRDPRQREILFDLETVKHRIFADSGKTADYDLLAKTTANLMRMWADV